MATATATTSSAWALVAGTAGAKKFNISNISGRAVEYRVATALPGAGDFGVELGAGATLPVDVAAGESIYARNAAGQTGAAFIAFDAVT